MTHPIPHRATRRRRAVAAAVLVGALLAVGIPEARGTIGHGPKECDVTPVTMQQRSPRLDAAAEAALAQSTAAAQTPYTYFLHVPEGLPPRPVPLLVAMHGLGGSATQFAAQSRWARIADIEKIVVAFPNGSRKWEVRDGSVDVMFIRELVAEIRAERCIDGRRIWAMGQSLGGYMAQRLACEAGDLFAAGAATAGGDVTTVAIGGPCAATGGDGYEPVPIGFWHGTADQLVNYQSQARASFARWAARYGCRPTVADAAASYGPVEVYGDCERADVRTRQAESEHAFTLRFRTYVGHRHGYPDGCGGLGELSREPCEPDPSAWPTAETHAADVLAFLRAHPRNRPAPQHTGGVL